MYGIYCSSRLFCGNVRASKKTHWAKLVKKKTNTDRALEHFDDFYSSVYGKRWPSIRLGLLSPTKFMAIPNVHVGNLEPISATLESYGGLCVTSIWKNKREEIVQQKKEIDLAKEMKRVKEMDSKLEAIATGKQAEELEAMYQTTALKGKLELDFNTDPEKRVLSSVSEASYVPTSKMKGMDEFMLESEYYSEYLENKTDSGELQSVLKYTTQLTFPKLQFPPLIKPYMFESGNCDMFPEARLHPSTGLREYLCVNGGSIAPILALDLRPNCTMLDLCSGPGTKSLMASMTMCLDLLVCNDLDLSRINRVRKLFKEFTGEIQPAGVEYTKCNAADYSNYTRFDRVLADVPCLSDRVSCTEPDNNIFKTTRVKERLSLVKLQKKILSNGLKCLKTSVGSTCVYSTCTLSPIENDGAVVAALNECERSDLKIDLISLWDMLAPFQKARIFKLQRTKCGVLVIPNVMSNCGPMFVSRIVVSPN